MSDKLLSILIPTTPDRKKSFLALLDELNRQRSVLSLKDSPEILWDETPKSDGIHREWGVGYKRNKLKDLAKGKYLAYIDSDDSIEPNYLSEVYKGIAQDVDACSLKGIITEDGQNPKLFIHSMRYTSWYEKDNIYYRNNNHLNAVKSRIAKAMTFPEIDVGEDHEYSTQLLKSGLIKTEYWIEDVIYNYLHVSNK